MTNATNPAPCRAAIPAAALAALLLAGCSTGHIGESWQCPLAEGGLCDSVAAADPAVPDPKAAGPTVLAEPLWRVRGGGDAGAAPPEAGTPCAAECDGGFDPFAWLARLLGTDHGEGDGPGSVARPGLDPGAGAGGAAREVPGPAHADAARQVFASSPVAAHSQSRHPDPPAAAPALPALGSREPVPASEPGGQAPGPSEDNPEAGDLRTGEIVARIWIAPFVDAGGVYREASHVRVVLEPAGWRLP